EDGIRAFHVTGVQTCALPIWPVIERGEAECVVANAAGCGAMLREYAHHLRDDPAYAERARALSESVRDISELLAPHGGELGRRIDRKSAVSGKPGLTGVRGAT